MRSGVRLLLLVGLLSMAMLDVPAPTDAVATDDEVVRFAVIGDFGADSDDARAVATLVKSWEPGFVITTGDNNYPRGEAATIDRHIGQHYHEFIHPYSGTYGSGATANRFFPSLGNHDWQTAAASPYRDYLTLPGNERYYDVVRGPVHLFALDSDPHEPDGVERNSAQARWLHDTLASSDSCWQLVYFHHPPFSSGEHGSHDWMRWPFKAWGADAVLAGHDHTYERIVVEGLPYFVNGLGGRSRYSFKSPVPGSTVRYNAAFGAMRIVADRVRITYEFVAVDGTVVDTYTQSGGCATRAVATVLRVATAVDAPAAVDGATSAHDPSRREPAPTTLRTSIFQYSFASAILGAVTVVGVSLGLRQVIRRRRQ